MDSQPTPAARVAAVCCGLVAAPWLLRLARIVRAFRLFPSLRVILVGIRRSLPGLGSFLLITLLMLYGYAMVGWMLFGTAHPEQYGTVGQAMLSLFLLLSPRRHGGSPRGPAAGAGGARAGVPDAGAAPGGDGPGSGA